MIGVPDGKRRHKKLTLPQSQRHFRLTVKNLARTRLGAHPQIAVVALFHLHLRQRLLGTREAALHTRAELAGHAILSRVDGQLDALFPAMILRVEIAAAAHAGRARGLLPTALGLACETLFLALRLFALAKGRFPLELPLTASLAVAAGPHRHLTGRHEQALGTQRIQQGAVMGDQQAHALEARKSCRNGLAGGDIDVVGGLVHNKQIGTLPERASYLQPLLLATGQGVVAPRPVVFHV